jgi:hypothetical protein
VPFLIGGDQVAVMSHAWQDERAPWGGALLGPESRPAVSSTYRMQVLAGFSAAAPDATTTKRGGGGLQSLVAPLEMWFGQTFELQGATVLGFAPVVAHFSHYQHGLAYKAPIRQWSYDPHLDALANQPPGAPEFLVISVSSWTRE